MKLNPRLPKGKAKIILGSLFLVALLIVITIEILSKSHITEQSTLELKAQENKFNLSFNLTNQDQKKAESLISKLALPSNLLSGAQFELDSTNSARLSFSSPVYADLNIPENQLHFNGTTSHPLLNTSFKPKNFKIPESAIINIFGANLQTFLLSRLNIPPELNTWINQHLKKDSPQYLLIFNSSDMALLWQDPQIDFSTLKNINAKGTTYKEENQEDISYHLYKLPKNKQGKETTMAFFNLNDFAIAATSAYSAKEIAKTIRSAENSRNSIDNTSETSYFLEFKNPQKKLDSNLKSVLFNDNGQSLPKEKIFNVLENISEFKLTLKGNSFSGLINW